MKCEVDKRKEGEIGRVPQKTQFNSEVNSTSISIDLGEEPIGLIVDEVTEVLKVNTDDIQLPPRSAVGGRADLLEGVARVGERLIVLLKIESLLSSSERVCWTTSGWRRVRRRPGPRRRSLQPVDPRGRS